MTPEEREAFLAGVHVGVLAIEEPDRGPLALPVWYLYRDGEVRIDIDGASLKARLLAAARRATLTVQNEALPYQYVSVEGPVVLDDSPRPSGDGHPVPRARAGPVVHRPQPERRGAIVVRLVPERWRTKDYGKLFPGGTDAS